MEAPRTSKNLVRVPYIADEQIALCASMLRAEYIHAGGPSTIALCPEELVWELLYGRDRLSLDTEASLGKTKDGDQIAGAMSVLPDGGMIQIDQTIVSSPLYHFTLGHEIGHWVLHRTCILEAHSQGNLFDETPREWVTLHRNVQASGRAPLPPEEWQANRFATHLLMPADLVIQQYVVRFGNLPINVREEVRFPTLRDCALAIATRPFPGLSSLATEFEVSKLAMAIRLEELRLVRDEAVVEGLEL